MNTTENCDIHHNNECDCIGQCKYNSNTTTEDAVEKEAKKIIGKFKKQLLTATPSLNRPSYQARECAIICVDEILLSIQDTSSFEDKTWQFWHQVLEKIKSL